MVSNMLSWPLYKKEFKSHMVLFLIFIALVMMYGFIVVSLFNPDPEQAGWLTTIIEAYPEMMDLIGFNIADFTNYQSFIAGYLYGMLFLLFGIIYTILMSNRLIYRYLDKGSFGFILSTPNSRSKILLTQISVLVTYLLLLSLSMFIITGLGGLILYPDYVDVGRIFYLNASYFLLMLLIGSFNVLSTSAFEGKIAFSLNMMIPIIFFFFMLISNLGGNFEWIQYLTPFSLFNVDEIISLSALSFVFNGILLGSLIAIFGISLVTFNKRDLNL